jgi:uncharacterized protein YndB with AHSA1/START domain
MSQQLIYADKFGGKTDDREIIVSRVFDAPRKLVFKAWTDPAHLINWWGPAGFTNTFYEIEIKPGGKWRFVMHGPNGMDFPNFILFTEVIAPERLEYYHGSSEEEEPSFKVTVTFEEMGNKTKLTMHSIFPSAEERDMVVREYRALEGANQTLDKLELELSKMSL